MVEELKILEKISKLIRYYILASTTRAGSGHLTSSLSGVELMSALLFGGYFRFLPELPEYPGNDRLIFSKGHASPLLYALWAAAGMVSEDEILSLRKFGSPLEGHPTTRFRYAEAATGSLGQGLSIGVGMALNALRLDGLDYRTYVFLGDSEMSEGSQWEAIQIASHYGLDNLMGIIDVNRLGQRGETMYGHDLSAYESRIRSFGWETFLVDGHSLPDILEAYGKALSVKGRPSMVIARTIKGKGVSFVEDQDGWHGKALSAEDFERALKELGKVEKGVRGRLARPADRTLLKADARTPGEPGYSQDKPVASRKAYGNALKRIYPAFPDMVVLDAEVSNSTYSEVFKHSFPERFFEMYIAEQNMAGVALGLSLRGKIPFVSTFAAFLARAFDQIRMSQYTGANIKFCGSHAGVSIGEDGPSQMGLEDLAMFRTIRECVVLYPSDAVSTERLVEEAAKYRGMVYIRTTRAATPLIYSISDDFRIGGSKVLRNGSDITVVAAGITLHEALKAHDALKKEGIGLRVIDLYSIKPIDVQTLVESARQTKGVITVEDHVAEGGLGEAVTGALSRTGALVRRLAVNKTPRSAKPAELLDFEEISSSAIIRLAREMLARQRGR